jgi:hypothetical protein
MSKLKSIIVIGLVFLIPIFLCFVPYPLSPDIDVSRARFYVVAFVLCTLLVHLLVRKFSKKIPIVEKNGEKIVRYGVLVLGADAMFLSAYPPSPLELPLSLIGILVVAAFTALYIEKQDSLEAPALSALMLCFCGVFFLEMALSAVPDDVLLKSVATTKPLAPHDGINTVYKKAGFRGKKACQTCPDNLMRIIAMGGSSTNGIPMFFSSRTYAAELQRILDERRVAENYEVLNAGLGGAGIMQVYSALVEELLEPFKPDIVIVNCWYNDHAEMVGWYGRAGESDKEGFFRTRMLRKLDNFAPYRALRNTRLFAFLRFYLLKVKKSSAGFFATSAKEGTAAVKRQPRSTPEEFRWGLEQIVELGKKHDFLPVFVYEPLNRTVNFEKSLAKNAYYRVIQEVASREGLPLVNVLDAMDKRVSEWLFYDFIHPNPMGHVMIAEEVYRALFSGEQSPWEERFWKSRDIVVNRPLAVRDAFLQYDRSKIPEKNLKIKARAPEAGSFPIELLWDKGNGDFEALAPLGAEFREIEIPRSDLETPFPIVDIRFRAELSQSETWPGFPIGKTAVYSPVPFSVSSGGRDHGWMVAIEVAGQRHDYGLRGYNAVVLGSKSGEVKGTGLFDVFGDAGNNEKLAKFLASTPQYAEDGKPPIVILAVKTDGRHNANPEVLTPALKSIGASGELPEAFSSYLLIGSPGAKPGTAIEKTENKLLRHDIGTDEASAARLIQVEPISKEGLLFASPLRLF